MALLLTNDDVHQVLDMQAAIAALEPAYRDLVAGHGVIRAQSQTYLPGPLPHSSYCLKTVEGGSEALETMAIRMTSDVIKGREIDGKLRREKIPAAPGGRFVGLVVLFSVTTGELLAIMPDGIIQRLRVGASSALAAERLARQDATTMGLIGAGNQAEAQLRGVMCVRNVEHIRVYSPTAERRKSFAERMAQELGVRIDPVDSPGAAVEGADIVATATNSASSVLETSWLKPGMHVGFIREFEADDETFRRADVLAVHTRQGEIDHYTPHGREDLAQLQRGRGFPWHEYPELADLIGGRVNGRTSSNQLTMFMNNFGIGIQFAALGTYAWRQALVHGCGTELPGDWFSEELQP
jgi:ornithine cyclodeaminase/alanine dehydrogenase-like protein (mu-crystallin family)